MVTQCEAEEFKISRHQDWYEKPYVREWTGLIAEHIREYVRTIQYDIWLPDNPSLEVVITGGSSAVKPMNLRNWQSVLVLPTSAYGTKVLPSGHQLSRPNALLASSGRSSEMNS